MKKLVSLTMAAMETWKRQILSHNSNGCKEEKMLLQKHKSYIFKLPVEKWVYWISARQQKMFQHENCTFWEKKAKVEKQNSFIFYDNLPQLCS